MKTRIMEVRRRMPNKVRYQQKLNINKNIHKSRAGQRETERERNTGRKATKDYRKDEMKGRINVKRWTRR